MGQSRPTGFNSNITVITIRISHVKTSVSDPDPTGSI